MILTWICLTSVLFVGGLAGYVALSVKKSGERALAALSALQCPSCKGEPFGAERSLQVRADFHQRNQEALADARSRGVVLRLDPHWRFSCGACAARLRFDPQTHHLELDPSAPTAS